MAVTTKQVARLVKRNRNYKITRGVTIFQNTLGWVKIRTDKGIDEFIDTAEQLNAKIDRWLLQGYEFAGDYEIPTQITSRHTVTETDD